MDIHCINLERAKERREKMEKSWKDFNIIFFDAIDKKYIEEHGDIIPFDGHMLPYKGGYREFNTGERACVTSNYFVLKQFLDGEYDWCFVSEDDVTCNTTPEILKISLDNMRDEYPEVDIFILHGKKGPCAVHESGKYAKLLISGDLYGAHFYTISRRGAEKLIKHLERMECPIDLYWKYFIKDKKIAICNYIHGIHIGDSSYICKTINGKYFD
jgi:GR25 family glycosyltransferase involved in LPS biosynthesis